ncbi:MAG: hypothetical protein MJH10_17485 [Epibacterium sp.]|nr:hypothetical protein [Epibacterium sp.]NQX75300.1 hypothetical protein [Epibacterium sp.]
MNIETEREVHELTLAAICHGRLLAGEWQETGLVPLGTTKQLTQDLLRKLDERRGLEELDEDRLHLLGEHIGKFTNQYREGLGDRALQQNIETEQVFDAKAIDLINLAWRWRQLRGAKRALDDKMAAIKVTDGLLAQV